MRKQDFSTLLKSMCSSHLSFLNNKSKNMLTKMGSSLKEKFYFHNKEQYAHYVCTGANK